MRDHDDYDDDHVRLYTPVLQRVIILAGVIIAVPVVMWTITTFVRSYVARPKAPALEHVASTTASVPIAAVAAAPPSAAPVNQSAAPRADTATAHEAPGPADLKKTATAALPDSSPSSVAANNPSVAPLQTEPAQTSSPAIVVPVAAAASDAVTPTASLPRPQAPQSTDRPAPSGASADRGIAWPNPNSDNPPDFAASRRPPPARVATVEVPPDSEPIRGPVPMPRQRPGIFALASSSPAPNSAVPLPRVRPADAPAEATNTIELPAGARPDLDSPH